MCVSYIHYSLILSRKAVGLLFPPPLQSDSCLGNRGKSSLCQTDVPFSWKLECVKTHETQIISKFSVGQREGEEQERKEKKKEGLLLLLPPSLPSTSLLCIGKHTDSPKIEVDGMVEGGVKIWQAGGEE